MSSHHVSMERIEVPVTHKRKSLLVRADFVLGQDRPADRLSYRRWRKILTTALPTLLGFSRRCPAAEHVCLHEGGPAGHFTAWLRLPVRRRPSRRRVRQLTAKLHRRLEVGLLPIHGEVLKIGIRRQVAVSGKPMPAPEYLPLFSEPSESVSVPSFETPQPECIPAA
jgi:hypothetical protein